MAEAKGKLVTCDRCGMQTFLKCTGEGERDGGYTRWNTFEDYPEGWEWRRDVGQLCPDCNQEYEKLIATFMKVENEVKNDGKI